MANVTLHIDGYPPAKSEASSMLGARHPHADRVRRLLEAARDAIDFGPETYLGGEAIRMRVVVHAPPGLRSDATNFLGGIADVLQDKRGRGASLEHLGELSEVHLFLDDAQIEQIEFEFRAADSASYTVILDLVRSGSPSGGEALESAHPERGKTDFENTSNDELIRHWAAVMEELRKRGIVRTFNNPVADIAETEAAMRLGLELETRSNRGYDAVDPDGLRYEVKSRRVTRSNSSRQLSPLRGLEERHFDFLVVVLYDEDLRLQEMWKIPVEHVVRCATYRQHVNGHVVHARGALLEAPAERVL